MVNRLFGSVLLSACLALAVAPASAQSGNSECAVVSISIVTGTATVSPGTTIGIGGGVKNCSSRKARYTLLVSAMSSCGQKTEVARSRLAFNPGENKIWSVSYPMPPDTCGGTWVASVEVRDNHADGGSPTSDLGAPLASASTTLTVE